ncbi:MAG: adenylate/guanylate cyclase domain-containing protein [Anaerolineales bacterium]|nr:adenylate/guanylate cyclase domain-containing protein [Anaerolineales bacterium]
MAKAFIQKAINFITTLGIKPDDSPDTRAIKSLLPVNVLAISILFLFVIGPIYIYFHEPFTGILYVSYGIFALINLWIYATIYKDHRILAKYLGISGLLVVLIGTIALGGIVNSGGVILWGLLVSMMSLIGLKMRLSIIIFSTYMGGIILIALLQPYMRSSNNLPPDIIRVMLATTFVIVSTLVFRGFAYFIDQRNKEEEKVERLLLNILPKEIATILKNKPHFIADQITMASILFADVVNFTPMSAKMTATELVELLNEVFSHFDLLVEKYGLEKIKTIGDCYMVASGVPQPRDDHAKILANMALELRDYTSSQTFQGKQLSFRIGINSGPVVAGIIGQKKFSYDLWGDTVNTASRMESHSTGNVIQITEDTYDLIKDDFICEPRGTITVKGKGEMKVWYLLSKKQ